MPDLVRPDEPHAISDTEAARRMALLDPEIDKWRQRVTMTLKPSPGSDFAEDDTAWPPFPCSQVAWQALATAVDNLDLIRCTVAVRRTFPVAIYSPVRAALVGVSLALWVMTPEASEERQRRGLVAAAERYSRIRAWASECGHTQALAQTASMEEDVTRLRATRGIKQFSLDTTDAVRGAAAYCFPDEPEWETQARSLWRTSSGDAHALGWQVLTRRHRTGDSDGVTSARYSEGSAVETFAAFNVCTRMARAGWALWERRQAAR